jgi:hypothetical protein
VFGIDRALTSPQESISAAINSLGDRRQEEHLTSANKSGGQVKQGNDADRLDATTLLYEHGEITAAQNSQSFILRLNNRIHDGKHPASRDVPKYLGDAILDNGKAKREAEMVLFGHWLLLDGRRGMKRAPGQDPDWLEILKCVAACLAELRLSHLKEKYDETRSGRSSRKRKITNKDLSVRWGNLFGETKKPEKFNKHVPSLKRTLSAYLDYLESHGYGGPNGKTVKASPNIRKVLDAISKGSAGNPAKENFSSEAPKEQTPAKSSRFEIELRYSSTDQAAEYRGPSSSLCSSVKLQYKCEPTTDGKEALLIKPDIRIRRNYKVNALVDRVVILVNLVGSTNRHGLQSAILSRTGLTTRAEYLTSSLLGWGVPLPSHDPAKALGQQFAIMIQDPTPEALSSVLEAIHGKYGVDGAVNVHLVEISVDFYPKGTAAQDNMIAMREKMVGLLQRHHWTPNSRFLCHDPVRPRAVDARQVYRAEKNSKTKYLFRQAREHRKETVGNVRVPAIRQRILSAPVGEDLFLNATLYKGEKDANYLVNIQHKIADRRNSTMGTKEILSDDQRRARVEVTISGKDILGKRGLATVNDLGKVSFRSVTKPYLAFKIGSIEPWQHLLDDARTQMLTRGVYGIELSTRARQLDDRDKLRKAGGRPPRKRDRKAPGLKSWPEMNDVVGDALDELKRRWRGFSWPQK